MMIDPGKLRHRVTVRRSTPARDGFGQSVPAWSDVGTYYAFVEPLSGRELVNARQVHALVTHRVTMRKSGALTPADRLVFQGRTLEPTSVVNVNEYGEWLVVLATERV